MRLVTGIAGSASGVLRRVHLGETLGLSDAGLVTADAKHRRVQLRGLHRRGIVSVLGLRSVAGLASHSLVHTLALYFENVGVTGFADLMSGVGDGRCRDFRDGVGPIVSVAAKAVRHKKTAQHQKPNQTYQKNGCQPEEVP